MAKLTPAQRRELTYAREYNLRAIGRTQHMADEEGPMTAAQLIDLLRQAPPDTLIVLAKDGEGNDFSPCAGYMPDSWYAPHSSWSGELIDDDEGPEGYEGAVRCICLWPTN